MGTQPLPKKGAEPPPIFGPCLLRSNGCIDQDATWYGGRPRPKRHCVRWGPSSPYILGGTAPSPIFGSCLLWPNSWMDQGGTWHGGGLWSRPHCARWGPSSPPQKGAEPQFSAHFLLWPNGWMHQDATWYGGRPQPRRLCSMGTQLPPEKKGTPTATQFLAHVYCGQTAGWMKTPLGTEVDIGPGHFVLDRFLATAKGAQQPPSFRPMSIVATVAHLSYC